MVREGWLARGQGNGEGRGRERFLPVPWERALDLVAAELARIKATHGHSAIMGGSQGWGSAGIFHDARTQVRRFLWSASKPTDRCKPPRLQAAPRAQIPIAEPVARSD
jgi:biotin/methionine sulfoxide reductase